MELLQELKSCLKGINHPVLEEQYGKIENIINRYPDSNEIDHVYDEKDSHKKIYYNTSINTLLFKTYTNNNLSKVIFMLYNDRCNMIYSLIMNETEEYYKIGINHNTYVDYIKIKIKKEVI